MKQAREDIIKRIFETSEAMKRGMYGHMQSYFQRLPISRAQLEILSAIHHLQPVSSKDIASQLYLTPGAVSQSVENLEQDGYIVREADPHDRRIQYLKVSAKGQKILHDIDQRRRDLLTQVMSELTLEELTVWLKVQTKTSSLLKATQTSDPAAHIKPKKEAK